MKNLEEQASNWLQSEICCSGNIVERTNAVVLAFRSYILEEKQKVCNLSTVYVRNAKFVKL